MQLRTSHSDPDFRSSDEPPPIPDGYADDEKAETLDQLRKLIAQFDQAHADFLRLSRERPDDPVTALKISFANQLIGQANVLLAGEERPFTGFDGFREDIELSNSDLMLVLGQYKCCLRKYGDEHDLESGYTLCWVSGATLSSGNHGNVVPFG